MDSQLFPTNNDMDMPRDPRQPRSVLAFRGPEFKPSNEDNNMTGQSFDKGIPGQRFAAGGATFEAVRKIPLEGGKPDSFGWLCEEEDDGPETQFLDSCTEASIFSKISPVQPVGGLQAIDDYKDVIDNFTRPTSTAMDTSDGATEGSESDGDKEAVERWPSPGYFMTTDFNVTKLEPPFRVEPSGRLNLMDYEGKDGMPPLLSDSSSGSEDERRPPKPPPPRVVAMASAAQQADVSLMSLQLPAATPSSSGNTRKRQARSARAVKALVGSGAMIKVVQVESPCTSSPTAFEPPPPPPLSPPKVQKVEMSSAASGPVEPPSPSNPPPPSSLPASLSSPRDNVVTKQSYEDMMQQLSHHGPAVREICKNLVVTKKLSHECLDFIIQFSGDPTDPARARRALIAIEQTFKLFVRIREAYKEYIYAYAGATVETFYETEYDPTRFDYADALASRFEDVIKVMLTAMKERAKAGGNRADIIMAAIRVLQEQMVDPSTPVGETLSWVMCVEEGSPEYLLGVAAATYLMSCVDGMLSGITPDACPVPADTLPYFLAAARIPSFAITVMDKMRFISALINVLVAANRDLASQLFQANQQLDSAFEQLGEQQQQCQDLTTQLAGLRLELNNSESRKVAVEFQLTTFESQKDTAMQQLTAKSEQLLATQNELKATVDQLTSMASTLHAMAQRSTNACIASAGAARANAEILQLGHRAVPDVFAQHLDRLRATVGAENPLLTLT